MRRLARKAAVWVTLPVQPHNVRVKDPMSGFFLVRQHSVENVEFQATGFKLLLDVLVRGRIQSAEEVPFAFGLRYRGASKANLKVGWDYALLLARLYKGKLKG